MVSYNKGNARGRGAGASSRGKGNGNGQPPRRNLPDVKMRFDRFCVWCGGIIPDLGLERHDRCPSNRCLRAVPFSGIGSRMDGLIRCKQCYTITHRSFTFCELCRRQTTEKDAHSNQINMQGVDPYVINMAPRPAVAVGAEGARAPVVASVAAPVVAPVAAPVVAPVAAPVVAPVVAPVAAAAPARAVTPVPAWANDDEDNIFM